MSPVLVAATEHVGAVGAVQALADIRRGAPADAVAHLGEVLGRRPTTHERGLLLREIGNHARSVARSMLTEAETLEDPELFGIDVDALERALAADEDAEPVYACQQCRDTGRVSFVDDEGLPEAEPCCCTESVRRAA